MQEKKVCYYKVLEIAKQASQDQIKKQYRQMAVKYHPDKNKEQNATQKFQTITEAYSILSDADKRMKYDKYGFEGDDDFCQDFNYNEFMDTFDFSDMFGFMEEMSFFMGSGGGMQFMSAPGGKKGGKKGRNYDRGMEKQFAQMFQQNNGGNKSSKSKKKQDEDDSWETESESSIKEGDVIHDINQKDADWETESDGDWSDGDDDEDDHEDEEIYKKQAKNQGKQNDGKQNQPKDVYYIMQLGEFIEQSSKLKNSKKEINTCNFCKKDLDIQQLVPHFEEEHQIEFKSWQKKNKI